MRKDRGLFFRIVRALLIAVLVILLAPYVLTQLYHLVNPVSTLML